MCAVCVFLFNALVKHSFYRLSNLVESALCRCCIGTISTLHQNVRQIARLLNVECRSTVWRKARCGGGSKRGTWYPDMLAYIYGYIPLEVLTFCGLYRIALRITTDGWSGNSQSIFLLTFFLSRDCSYCKMQWLYIFTFTYYMNYKISTRCQKALKKTRYKVNSAPLEYRQRHKRS